MKGIFILSNKWDIRYMQLAEQISTWSKDPTSKIGAVAVGDKGQVLAQGYNGYIAGCEHKMITKDNHNIATVHAEQNTITDCAKRGVSSNNCKAYITHYPCYNCMKLMVSCGICEINYIEDYKNDNLVKDLANEAKIEINKI